MINIARVIDNSEGIITVIIEELNIQTTCKVLKDLVINIGDTVVIAFTDQFDSGIIMGVI